jgi:hypothetical protein
VCLFKSAVSMKDLTRNRQIEPIEYYNRAIVKCFATDMQSPYSSIIGFTMASQNACQALSLDQVPQEAP